MGKSCLQHGKMGPPAPALRLITHAVHLCDDGVGPLPGQMLDPLVLDYDPGRQRMVVIERRGTLQVLDVTEPPATTSRAGGGDSGSGEFLVTPPTAVAVAVDGDGRVHVADAATPGGRVQTFAP